MTKSFTSTGSLTGQRFGHSAGLLGNGKLLIAGGNSNAGYPAAAELYDPATGQFTATGSLAAPRVNHVMTLLNDGRALVAAGSGTANLYSGEVYDPATGRFTTVGSVLSSSHQIGAATLLTNGSVLITAGFDGHVWSTTTELFVPGP